MSLLPQIGSITAGSAATSRKTSEILRQLAITKTTVRPRPDRANHVFTINRAIALTPADVARTNDC